MADSIILEKSILAGTNKAGILKPDSNGYYHVVLGAFDAENAHGVNYPFNDYLKKMFKADSLLQQRIAAGRVRSEVEHPEIQPGMKLNDYLNRLRFINGKFVNSHIAKVKLSEVKDHTGKTIIQVEGWVKPSGIHGAALEAQLKNKEENVCYSIRSIISQGLDASGRPCNFVRELITWDSVNDPGMENAHKFASPGLESLTPNVVITPELLIAAERSEMQFSTGLESGGMFDTTMIRDAAGWSKIQVVKPTSAIW